ncbi:MAG TPA: transglycosylase SLT domain-containing protein [Nocardioidaceae bacterium]|jgi:cell wall-associated NlpC family hydrolase
MSLTDVTARIQQLQSQLAALAPATVRPAGVAPGQDGGVLGGQFAAALASAESSAGTGAVAGTAAAGAVPPGGGATGAAVVAEARKYLGVPYMWGGTDPSKGLDCSGLVQLVYRRFGIDLPRVSYQQATAGRPVASLAQARPGDILAFDSPVDHVAIYIGGNKMIEAPRTGLDVRVSVVYETPTAIRRVLPEASAPSFARTVAGTGDVPAGTPYASLFERAGRRYGVSPTLLAAVATQESGFDPTAVSPAGAKGLMQLMPATAAGLGVNPLDPAQAVDGAARLLRGLIGEFGRTDLALAAYNAGPGAVHRYGGIPPYPETRAYVPAVLAHQARLEAA